MQENMMNIYEGKRYKLTFSNRAEVNLPTELLDGVTSEKISGRVSMLIFSSQQTNGHQWDWYPNLMLMDIPGAILKIRIHNMQSIHWRAHYEKGFVIWIEDGKPYLYFDVQKPILVEYRQDNV